MSGLKRAHVGRGVSILRREEGSAGDTGHSEIILVAIQRQQRAGAARVDLERHRVGQRRRRVSPLWGREEVDSGLGLESVSDPRRVISRHGVETEGSGVETGSYGLGRVRKRRPERQHRDCAISRSRHRGVELGDELSIVLDLF